MKTIIIAAALMGSVAYFGQSAEAQTVLPPATFNPGDENPCNRNQAAWLNCLVQRSMDPRTLAERTAAAEQERQRRVQEQEEAIRARSAQQRECHRSIEAYNQCQAAQREAALQAQQNQLQAVQAFLEQQRAQQEARQQEAEAARAEQQRRSEAQRQEAMARAAARAEEQRQEQERVARERADAAERERSAWAAYVASPAYQADSTADWGARRGAPREFQWMHVNGRTCTPLREWESGYRSVTPQDLLVHIRTAWDPEAAYNDRYPYRPKASDRDAGGQWASHWTIIQTTLGPIMLASGFRACDALIQLGPR